MRLNVADALEALGLKDGNYIRIEQDVYRVVVDWAIEVTNGANTPVLFAFLEFVNNSSIRLPFYLIYYSDYVILDAEESAKYAATWELNRLEEVS